MIQLVFKCIFHTPIKFDNLSPPLIKLLALSTYNEPNQISDARCWIHICPEETDRITFGSAAWAGHGSGADGGVVFDVEGLEDVTAVGATE